MRRRYYISNGLDQDGPFALEELENQNVSGSTLVWHEGLEGWKPAAEIMEVQGVIKDKPKPPPIPNMHASDLPFTPTPNFPIQKKKSVWKVLLYIGIAGAVLFIGYLWYLDTVYYPRLQDEAEFEEQLQLQQEEEERLRIQEEERQAEERRKYIRNNFDEYLTLSNPPYTSFWFGGIEDLSIQIENSSEYRFDKVTVEIAYIKDDGDIFKYEEVEFGKLKAKQVKTLKAPNSDRGTSVRYYISYASSEKLNFEYFHNSFSSGDDPYKMR